VFYLGILFFSSIKKKKKTQEKKTIEKKKNVKKGRSLPSNSHSALSLLALASAFPLLHFRFKHFLLASSSSQAKEKKKNTKKKNHSEENKCREERELTFKLPFYPLIFGSYFCPPAFALLFQALSFDIFFFSNR
jgi:hypothetical protein